MTREQRALEIADRFRIVESSGKWIVPSQSTPPAILEELEKHEQSK